MVFSIEASIRFSSPSSAVIAIYFRNQCMQHDHRLKFAPKTVYTIIQIKMGTRFLFIMPL